MSMSELEKEKEVEGVILMLSCQKHLERRLKKFDRTNYDGWEVVYVVGELFLDCSAEFRDNNFLYVKCEDSYLHLLKKLSLSIKFVNEIFTIRQGILKCDDDLIWNEHSLLRFLNSKTKPDFCGRSRKNNRDYHCENTKVLKKRILDRFLDIYYRNHQEYFKNPQHNLGNMSLQKLQEYLRRPDLQVRPFAPIYYLSNKCCTILVRHMENIDYNIFHLDSFTNSYPYTLEDVGVSYIMYFNKIKFTDRWCFMDSGISIATHTNEIK